MKLRNIAIIAHVDHGKTTLVDGLLKQSHTFRENEAAMGQELIMDSNAQERERGITILAKNTAVIYKDTKINIVDTPGHADFGGEVERTLNMADGVLLLVDAQEGPMPQTKFVLRKALELKLKVIVVVNKIDKKDARTPETIHKISDLFLELAKEDADLDFPTIYAIGRDGKAWADFPADFTAPADLTPVFDAILKYIPEPKNKVEGPFQMLVSNLDWDSFKGKYAVGRVERGSVKPGLEVVLMTGADKNEKFIVDRVYVNQGLKRIETEEAFAGDIVALTGVKNANIGDTVADAKAPEALPKIKIEEPTLRISIGPNTSPSIGKDGTQLTGTKVLERIKKELQTNVSMRFAIAEDGSYVISGRGELHLSVFLETLRREGFEIEVGKPQIITKEVDGETCEPTEELTVDIPTEYVSAITSEILRRRGQIVQQDEISSTSTRMVFDITTRGTIGLRALLLTLSKGTAVVSTAFNGYKPVTNAFNKLRKGVLIASEAGITTGYGLNVAQEKGPTFVGPNAQVYAGMIVGQNGRDEDLEINVCREKKLSNVRSVGENAIVLIPPVTMSLEQSLGFLEDDELLEITPKNLRLRKKILDGNQRNREARRNSN
jgi:GTP-binding protein